MTQDASFEDGRERPLNLGALDQDDLQVVSTLIQDAVFPASEMIWDASQRRFAILINRFRWEDRSLRDHPEVLGRPCVLEKDREECDFIFTNLFINLIHYYC